MSGEAPKEPEGLSQADIDAAFGGAQEETPSEGDPKPADAGAETNSAPTSAEVEGESTQTPVETAAASGEAPKLDSMGRPFDEAAAMMEAAIAEEKAAAAAAAVSAPLPPPPANSVPLELPDFGRGGSEASEKGIDLINDVALNLKIELGRASMCIEDVLKLGEGSIVELDKLAGDPVDVFVNERLVARGEVLVLNDNFCVRVSEIVTNEEEVPV